MGKPVYLIGDVGGTNARFALTDADGLSYHEARTVPCAAFPSPEAAIQSYLADHGLPPPTEICIAAAGPVFEGRAQFTNNPWTLCEAQLEACFGSPLIRVSNDFEAIAHALPHLKAQDLLPLGAPALQHPGKERFCFAVVGPGTGLGAAALFGQAGHIEVAVSEAGHMGFAAEDPLQDALLATVRKRQERVSAERLISGPGIENLYQALGELQGRPIEALATAEIFAAADQGEDRLATEALTLFQSLLGQFAGDFALAVGAQDGVFLAGGVAQKLAQRLGQGHFRRGFERKGRHQSLMERIPTALITHPQPGLLGAMALLRDLRKLA